MVSRYSDLAVHGRVHAYRSMPRSCEKGWSELHLTSKVLGAMMALEGRTLLRSTGRPVNACLFGMMAQVALGEAVELEA